MAAVGGRGVPPAAAVAGPARARRSAPRRPAPRGGDDYTYGRPSRRSAGLPGVVLPSLRRRPPQVCVIIDTSGSVSDAELGSALLEVAAIGRAVGGRRDLVSVMSCDAAAGVAHPLCRAEGIPLIGGGGTDLRAGFAQGAAHDAPPRRRRGPDRRADAVAGRPAAVPHGGRPVPPPRRSWDEHDPDYVPDPPPDWARVVHIG